VQAASVLGSLRSIAEGWRLWPGTGDSNGHLEAQSSGPPAGQSPFLVEESEAPAPIRPAYWVLQSPANALGAREHSSTSLPWLPMHALYA
jgi:hypothetical protein